MDTPENWWTRRYKLLISEGPEATAEVFLQERPIPIKLDLEYATAAIKAALRLYDPGLAYLWSRYAYCVRSGAKK